MTRRQNFWLALLYYPYTVVEAVAMAGCALVLTLFAQPIFSDAFFVFEKRKSDKHKRIKEPFDTVAALNAMKAVEQIARECNANIYWISGTLLGLERIGTPLPHDHDLDLGINSDDPALPLFVQTLAASKNITVIVPRYHGLKRRIQNPDLWTVRDGLLRYTLEYCENAQKPVKIDLFLHFQYGANIIHLSRYTIWENSPFKVVQREYGSNRFSVPSPPSQYLAENYGDYSVEQKEFENSIDCPNVRNIYSWDSLFYLFRRRQLMLKRGWVKKDRNLARRIWRTIGKGLYPRVQIR
jgi:hypothetical protein